MFMAESTGFVDYYHLLGVSTNAEPSVIRDAFIALAKKHHPDVGGSTEQMQQFSNAYRTLMSEKSRKAYDLLHDFHTGNGQVQYREYGNVAGTSIDDLTDDEIDDFLDVLYAEYRAKPREKTSFITKLKNFF